MAQHFGNYLRGQIAAAGKPVAVFAKDAGVSRSRLNEWLSEQAPSIHDYQLGRLARALGTDYPSLNVELEEAKAEEGKSDLGGHVKLKILNLPDVEPVRLSRRIPRLGSISAARLQVGPSDTQIEWLDLDERDHFLLLCDGDCMEPDWHDQELIVFSRLDVEKEGILDGADYAICLTGEEPEITFKRVFKDPRNSRNLLLRCANQTRYKAQRRISRDAIATIGRAVWAMRPGPKRSPR